MIRKKQTKVMQWTLYVFITTLQASALSTRPFVCTKTKSSARMHPCALRWPSPAPDVGIRLRRPSARGQPMQALLLPLLILQAQQPGWPAYP